jgi:uncharacterized protein (DUF488 family)
MKVFTVGYEGYDIDDFVKYLKKRGVKLIADLRKNPISRKKGFSKNKLAENLRARNIDYRHLPGLGVPTHWRQQAKAEQITREKMFQDYVKQILPAAKVELKELKELASQGGLALLCYEKDYKDCHRYFVAKRLRGIKVTVI